MMLKKAHQRVEGRADRLFRELDNRRIEDGSGGWVAQVQGIHIAKRDVWVQIAPAGEPDQSLVLHLPSRATANDAIVALGDWSKTPIHERVPTVHVVAHRNPPRTMDVRQESDPLAA